MQRKRLRQYCKIYGASKERNVARVSNYPTSTDVSSIEDKETWMLRMLPQSVRTWRELHTVRASPVSLCELADEQFCWHSEITFSFLIRPTEGNSFCAEAPVPALPSWECAFEQVKAAEICLDFWIDGILDGGDSRRWEGIDCQGPCIAVLSFEKQRGLLHRSLGVDSPTLTGCWWLISQYESTCSNFHSFLKNVVLLTSCCCKWIILSFTEILRYHLNTIIVPRRICLQSLSQDR